MIVEFSPARRNAMRPSRVMNKVENGLEGPEVLERRYVFFHK